MNLIVAIVAVLSAFAAAAAAADAPAAKARGLVVARGRIIYVDGKPVARGAERTSSANGKQLAFIRNGEIVAATPTAPTLAD